MRIAYIITAYQDPFQLKRLIQSLNSNADFFIHIDERVNIDPFVENVREFENVIFTPKRYFINWGSFAQVLAQKELLRVVLNEKKDYDRIVCLSGADYPIWSNDRIFNEYRTHLQKQYISGCNLSITKDKKQIERVTVYHFFRDLKVKKRTVKKIFSGFSRILMKTLPIRKKKTVTIAGKEGEVYMGSDYWSLTYSCAKYVYNTMCNEKSLMNYFRHSYVPSEMCVQTIVFNSPYSEHAIKSLEDYSGLPKLTPLHYIIYTNAIKIFNETDYNTLVNSDKMFFRKAKTGYSDKLIKRIDEKRNSKNA